MSQTILNIQLSAELQKQLQHQGVWASAVYFIDDQPHWTSLVTNGNLGSAAIQIALPEYFNSGKVYILIQSADPAGEPATLEDLIRKESDINLATAQEQNIRFDSIELTLGVSPSDSGNLTSVVGFGLPMQMQVHYTDGSPSQSAGYNISGQKLFELVQAIPSEHPDGLTFNFTAGPLAGQPRYATSPASAGEVSPSPFLPADWVPYLESLWQTPGTLAELGGFYNGAPDAQGIWHNAAFYHYKLVSGRDGSTPGDDTKYFWLLPEANSQVQGQVRISLEELANSIYATNGQAEVLQHNIPTTLFAELSPAEPYLTMNVGVNNQWGKLFTELITGFSAGLLGGVQGKPVNPGVSELIDLGQSWNWMPNYAFGQNVEGLPAGWHIDHYSEILFNDSNSYGSMYSDNLMEAYAEGGPLLSLANAKTIDLTIYADHETPGGYVTPKLYDYLAPTAADSLYDPTGTDISGINLTLGLALAAGDNGQTTWMADPANTVITIDVLTGYDNDHPVWQSIVLDSRHAGGADGSLWWNWSIQPDAGSGGFTAQAVSGTAQTPGNLVLTGLPVPANGTAWTKITVADTHGENAKTFNLYSTTQDGAFVHDAARQVIDGGAVIALPSVEPGTATVHTYSINLLSGSSTAIDPGLLIPGVSANGFAMMGTPAAPVVSVLRDTDAPAVAVAGQDSLSGGTVHTTFTDEQHNLVSFGWTGTNSGAADLSGWLRAYTNKAGALDLVRLDITRQEDAKVSHIVTQADLDGQWSTPGHVFEPGTYSVTLGSYDTHDTNFMAPLSAASYAITLIVDGNATGGALGASRLELDRGMLALDTGAGEHAGVVYRLYQAALDRSTDPEGLGYWLDTIESGQLSLLDLARHILASEEFTATNGAAASLANNDFIDLVYQYLFQRDPDAQGERYWMEQLDAGADQATILLAIAEAPETLIAFAGDVEHGLWLL